MGEAIVSRSSTATTKLYTANLLADDWTGSEEPYTQTITATGLLNTDTPFIDIVQSSDTDMNDTLRNTWTYITRITATTNTLTAYAVKKPEVDIPIRIKVVR